MSHISTAVSAERLARGSGYRIKKGIFSDDKGNLPQAILILGEANSSHQTLLVEELKELTSANEAADLYGPGSPIHQVMRILRPINGDGVGGIPTFVIPQKSSVLATATTRTFEIVGTPTKSGIHRIRISGRYGIDFKNYDFEVLKDDLAETIAERIADKINSCQSCPVSALASGEAVLFTSKWKGSTSAECKISFDYGKDDLGLTYTTSSSVDGVGAPDFSTLFDLVAENWFTTIINTYGVRLNSTLEEFNGKPYLDTPTGRYSSNVFKPFMAFYGTTLSTKDDLADLTVDSQTEVTNVICAAPNSEGFSWEAAANVVRLFCRTMQDTPERDVNGMAYPDMPIPIDGYIGDMSSYNNRDFLVKKGVSTVTLNKGSYEIEDLVTSYHPDDETPLQFSYARNLNLDWNIFDAYRIVEKNKLKDKVLIRDNQTTDSQHAVKPKEFVAVIYDLFERLGKAALINDPDFSKKSLKVEIDGDNPNRFNTTFRYKRTGIARIQSTDVEAGF